jgi:DNA-binding CsgD family transcriptional regulator
MAVVPRFVGRAEELRALVGCLDRARSGRPLLAAVEGEAGIGKSRLLAELISLAGRSGFDVCRSGAEEMEPTGPFRPLLAALDVPRHGDGALLPSVDGRFALLESLWERLEERAATAPVLLVLDDVQWADAATLLALRILPRRLAGTRVAAVLALRPTPRPAELSRVVQEAGTHLRLAPIDGSGWRTLQAELLGDEPDEALCRWLDGAGGNPFLLTQLVESALRDGGIARSGGRVRLRSADVPRTFRDTARRHLAQLASETVDQLRVASVIGTRFTLDQLATVLDVPAAQLVPGLLTAVDAGVLVPDGDELAFRHDLLREAVYEDLPSAVRRGVHLDAARRLAARGASAATLARHVIAGARPGDPEAADRLRQAGLEVAPGDPGTGADLLLRAFDLAPPADPARSRAGADAVRLLAWAGRLQDAERAAARVLAAGPDPETEAALRLGLVEAMVFRGKASDVLGQVDAALARPAGRSIRAGLRAAEANARLFVGGLSAAEDAGREAVALGEAAGDDNAVCFGLVALSCVARLRGSFDVALELVERAVALGGEARRRYQPGLFHAAALWALDRADEAQAVLARGLQAAQSAGSTWSLALWHIRSSRVHQHAGRLSDAAAEAETGLALADQWETWSMALLAVDTLVQVSVHRNDLEQAQVWLNGGHDLVGRGVRFTAEHLAWSTSLLAEARGDRAQAFAQLAAVYATLPDTLPTLIEDPIRLTRLTALAMAAGDRERAAAAAMTASRLVEALPSVPSLLAADLGCRGLLSGDAELLDAAVDAASRASRPIGWADLCERAAADHVRAGATSRAVELLDGAAGAYRAAGADRDTARVLAALRRLGVRRRTAAPAGRPGLALLTPTETEVARLVAEGLTNRAIGERMYISPHTVDTHLRHIFAKLSVTSRAALAGLVSRVP